MSGVNKVIIVGHLGGDPEVKTVGQGATVARFNVATSESWTGKDGQKKDNTEWHRIVVWNKLAEICSKFLSKGRQVYVEGRLQTRQWDDQNGQKRYTTEIIANTVQFLGGGATAGAGSGMGATAASRSNAASGPEDSFQNFGPEPTFGEGDDIPF